MWFYPSRTVFASWPSAVAAGDLRDFFGTLRTWGLHSHFPKWYNAALRFQPLETFFTLALLSSCSTIIGYGGLFHTIQTPCRPTAPCSWTDPENRRLCMSILLIDTILGLLVDNHSFPYKTWSHYDLFARGSTDPWSPWFSLALYWMSSIILRQQQCTSSRH
jgi:hypothetical protein